MKKIFSIEILKHLTKEGQRYKVFYLPVKRDYMNGGIECWLLPIAPIAMIYYIVFEILWFLWRGLVSYLDLLLQWNGKT